MNFDKRSESTVALTSYITCSDTVEGGIDGPASPMSTIDENKTEKNSELNHLNSDDVLIDVKNLSWDEEVNSFRNKQGSNDKARSNTETFNKICKASASISFPQNTRSMTLKNEEESKEKLNFYSERSISEHFIQFFSGKGIENMSSDPEQMKVRLKYNYDIPVSPGKGDPSPKTWLCERIKKSCTKKLLYKRIPILSWLPQYKANLAIADLVAGFTVGLTVIPQAIAYANVAGLPPQYGLYSSFMACFIYTIFGSCKDSPIGPTAITAILTRENLHALGPEFAVLLCFLSGCVEFLMGVLQLGFLIDFISGPVSAGFTSAAAIIIATSQVKDVLGLSFSGGSFLDVWENIFYHISETRPGDAVLGIICMTVLLALRKIKDIRIGPKDVKDKTKVQVFFSQLLWFVSTSRNIIVVVVCAVIAYALHEGESGPFMLTGTVKGGLPEFHSPPFSAVVGNRTYSFPEMSASLGSALLVVPLLSILENMSLAKVFAKGKSVDATQEMLAIGLCNIASSFVSSMPVSGALSRGAVNNASGVQTTFGGIYTGIIVLVSLQFFTPYFYFIPKASLAAVIIAAVVFMVEFHVVKPMWKTKKIDLIPAFGTFFSCLLIRLELGIVIGISINILFLLYASARPTVRVEKEVTMSGCEYLRVTPDRSLVFPSVEYVRNVVSKAGLKQGSSYIPVVIDSRHIQGVDFTAAKGVKSLIDDFMSRKQPILFYNLKPSIVEIFQGVRPKEFIYCTNEAELNDFLKQYHSQA